jgi:L-amino acid N-acyltransferase YncA
MREELNIRRASTADAVAISKIYNAYVLNTIVTFETAPLDVSDLKQRIEEKLVEYDWIVVELNQQIVGYAYYGSFRPRAAYHHTVESTIYISEENQGKGVGRRLYSALIHSANEKGFRELIGVVALPNPASVALHKALGFQEVGLLRGVGCKFGQYLDVSLWQRSLTRQLI